MVCLSSVSLKTLTITVPWRSWDNTAVPGERDEGSVRGHSSFHRRLLAFPGENYEWPPLANIFHGSFMILLRCENTWCSRSTPQTTTVSSWTSLLRGWSVTQVGKSARHKFTHLVSNEEKSLATICNNRHSLAALVTFIMITNTQSELQTWARPCSWWGSLGLSLTRRTCLPGKISMQMLPSLVSSSLGRSSNFYNYSTQREQEWEDGLLEPLLQALHAR